MNVSDWALVVPVAVTLVAAVAAVLVVVVAVKDTASRDRPRC
ncbi:hypothetical protein ACIRQF_07980 [Streptomyces sp. NPDC101191]